MFRFKQRLNTILAERNLSAQEEAGLFDYDIQIEDELSRGGWSDWIDWTPRMAADLGSGLVGEPPGTLPITEPDWTDVSRKGRYRRQGPFVHAEAEIVNLTDTSLTGVMLLSVPVPHDEVNLHRGSETGGSNARPVTGAFWWQDTNYGSGGISQPITPWTQPADQQVIGGYEFFWQEEYRNWFRAGPPQAYSYPGIYEDYILRWSSPGLVPDQGFQSDGLFAWSVTYFSLRSD